MLLEKTYFELAGIQSGDGAALAHVRLQPGCDVYRGHFPGHPVSPGACNIEMVRECFCKAIGQEARIATIDRCRLTAVASPTLCPELDIVLSWTEDDGWCLSAVVKDDRQQYLDFKGTLKTGSRP